MCASWMWGESTSYCCQASLPKAGLDTAATLLLAEFGGGGWGRGQHPSETPPGGRNQVLSLPLVSTDLAEQSYHALTSPELTLQPGSFRIPEPMHSLFSLLFPLPEISFLNFHILFYKVHCISKEPP